MRQELSDQIISIKYDKYKQALYALGKKSLFIKGDRDTEFQPVSTEGVDLLGPYEFSSFVSYRDSVGIAIVDAGKQAVVGIVFKDDVTSAMTKWRQVDLPHPPLTSMPLSEYNMCVDEEKTLYFIDPATGNIVYSQDWGRNLNLHDAISTISSRNQAYDYKALQVSINDAERIPADASTAGERPRGKLSFFLIGEKGELHYWEDGGAGGGPVSSSALVNFAFDAQDGTAQAIYADNQTTHLIASSMNLYRPLTRGYRDDFSDSLFGRQLPSVRTAMALSSVQLVKANSIRSFYTTVATTDYTLNTREDLQQIYWFFIADENEPRGEARGVPTSIPLLTVNCMYQHDGVLYIGTPIGVVSYREENILPVKPAGPDRYFWYTRPEYIWQAWYNEIADMCMLFPYLLMVGAGDALYFWLPYSGNNAAKSDSSNIERKGEMDKFINTSNYTIVGVRDKSKDLIAYITEINLSTELINSLRVSDSGYTVDRWETSFSGLLTAMPVSKHNSCVDEDGYVYLMDVPTGNIIYSDYIGSDWKVHDKLTNAVKAALKGRKYELLNINVSTRFDGNGLSAFIGTTVGDVIVYGDDVSVQAPGLRTRNYAYDPVYDNLVAFHYDDKASQVVATFMQMKTNWVRSASIPFNFRDIFPQQSVPLAISTLDPYRLDFYAAARMTDFDDLYRIYKFGRIDLTCKQSNVQPFPLNGMLQINGYGTVQHQLCLYTATQLWLTYDELDVAINNN